MASIYYDRESRLAQLRESRLKEQVLERFALLVLVCQAARMGRGHLAAELLVRARRTQ